MPSLQTLPGIEFVPLNNSQWRLQESTNAAKLLSWNNEVGKWWLSCTADTTIVLFDNL